MVASMADLRGVKDASLAVVKVVVMVVSWVVD